ncbi:hypothetical protein [Petroclostridium sp. X23]|uniref:hypothetical protein n=1 Tax=Petroclostridium sp. X23 TaxID=3045146 RepID=UPI0024ADF627|nr:hypothetical protein [Petroclostridium sp. X23]WHH60769.1 hypothetical protein QKW49_08745 [Petroclostridium sp. X23]
MAYFGTGEASKKYEKISEQTSNGNTTVKYRNGNQNFTVVFNKPSDVALKRFANTVNDIVTDIANKRVSA